MAPRRRLFRAVEWAIQISYAGLILVVFGFLIAYSSTLHLSSGVALGVLRDDRLPTNAAREDYERQEERHRPVREAAHRTAVAFVVVTAGCVGAPVALLLVGNIVLLYRIRSLLRQGV